jgi:hypothetical protein
MTQQYLTENDVYNYGNDFIDVSQRAALHAIAPHLQQLQNDNADLRARQAREARRALDERVAAAVPNYRDYDRDARWHQWLRAIDVMSGRVRQQLLNEAISSGDTNRVVAFFKQFEALPVYTSVCEDLPCACG